MKCPKCNSYQVNIVDTLPRDYAVRRRRKCLNCDFRFSTIEVELGEYVKMKGNNYEKERLRRPASRK